MTVILSCMMRCVMLRGISSLPSPLKMKVTIAPPSAAIIRKIAEMYTIIMKLSIRDDYELRSFDTITIICVSPHCFHCPLRRFSFNLLFLYAWCLISMQRCSAAVQCSALLSALCRVQRRAGRGMQCSCATIRHLRANTGYTLKIFTFNTWVTYSA